MADKPGDIFTDEQGNRYELRPDPKDGHLRPYTIDKGNDNGIDTGCGSGSIGQMIATAAVLGFVSGFAGEIARVLLDRFTKSGKDKNT
jgi:hypothetical protein